MKLKFAKNKGFTLVEILVVVLIIGILAVIALPSYQRTVLKSRAGEAVNLLTMLRSKQAVNFARDKRFFTGFNEIPGGRLTLGQESYDSATNNLLVVGEGNYEVELLPESQCAISRYKQNGETIFEFSISYLRNGLGCTGDICDSFPDVVDLADDFCNAPIPPAPPATCPDPNFDPSSCVYPTVLSIDGCSCQCPTGIEQSCSDRQTYNPTTCTCECDQSKVPVPSNPENFTFNTISCDYECNLNSETCLAQDKLFDKTTCECVCRMEGGVCCCPEEDQVNIGGVCMYCSGHHYIVNGVGYCCDDPSRPFFNKTTRQCEPCPTGSDWSNTLKQCVCVATSRVFSETTCVCDSENGWQPASYGTELVSGCCNENTSNYIADNPSACCPVGVNSFTYSWRSSAYATASTRRMCCTTERPYVHSTPNGTFTNTTPSINNYCRKCPNATDTWNEATGQCEPCPSGTYADTSTMSSLGYATCSGCQSPFVLNSDSTGCVCDSENGWQPASYGTEIVSGCCNTNTSNYISANPSACCPAGVNSFTYSWRSSAYATASTRRMCCSTERPYVHSTPNGTFTNSAPSVNTYCRKCPNATDTWNEATGQCEPCPSGTYADTSTIPSLGYATCSSCQAPLVLNSNSTGCVCDSENGWQPASFGTDIVSGCCNTNTSNYIEGDLSACCPAGVNSFTYSWRSSAYATASTRRMCCTTERPYVHSTPNGSFTNSTPSVNTYCRKCQNATDTWNEETGQCESCPSGTYADTSTISSLGYATCSGCQSPFVLNSDSTGCVCDSENGWQPASYGTEIVSGCCNTNTSNYIADNPSACCPAGVGSFTYSWRSSAYATASTRRMCCTTERPYVHSTPNGSFTNSTPSVNTYCRKCPNATDTWNEATGQCEPCPTGTYADTSTISSLGYATCSGCQTNQVVTSTGCACDSENGWQAASYGTELVSGCCNTNTSNYISANPSACCPAGVNSFTYSWRSNAYVTASTRRMCCSTERPYVHSTPNGSFTNSTPSVDTYCRKCQNATDTMVNGVCKSCSEAFPGQNKVGIYNAYDGYAQCVCPNNTFENDSGVCTSCPEGYSYTSGSGMQDTPHCCHPNYTVDTTTTNGCSQCPIGSHFSNNCKGCLCDSSTGYTGFYEETNQCTKDQCTGLRVFALNTCKCVCPVIDGGTTHLTWSVDLGCCYCELKDLSKPYSTEDPLFSPNGCYIGANN